MVGTNITEERIDSIEKRISQLEYRFYFFLYEFSKLFFKEREPSEVKEILEKFKAYLNKMRKENPISKEENERIKKYCDKIEGRVAFTLEELEDFRNLCQKMSEKIPSDKKDDFDWVVSGLLGYITGAMIGDLLSKIQQKREDQA